MPSPVPAAPFTREEFRLAYELILSKEEAAELADAHERVPGHELGREHTGPGLRYRSVATADLSEDTLILLSLVSEELHAKVRAYRDARNGGRPESPEEMRAWLERREMVKRSLGEKRQ